MNHEAGQWQKLLSCKITCILFNRGYPKLVLDPKGPNLDELRFWNETAGAKWVENQQRIDAHARSVCLLAIERPTTNLSVFLCLQQAARV